MKNAFLCSRNIFLKAIIACFLLPFCAEAQTPSLDTLMNHVRALSSSRYEGRLAGTDAYFEAADYAIQALARYGVQPYQGEWGQYFQLETNEIENCTFQTYVNANDTKTVYVLGKDFCCAGMTGRGYADAGVVFCGYGIDNPAFNEYANVDAQGKIALVLSGVPTFLPSAVTDNFRTLRDKARAAQRHGACALVVINMNSSCLPYEVQGSVYSGEKPHLPTFPIIQPHKNCGAKLLKGEKMELDSVVALIQQTMTPQSFHLRKHFEIEVNAKYHPEALTTNVVGIYPGTDKQMSNEYIVVGAHLDHLGMQGRTCLFPGADDNASGVAALLEVARMLSLADEQPARSVVFVLFSGAESQYLGSQVFVSNFSPLKRIEAFINIESIGSGDSVMVQGNKRFPHLWNVANDMDSIFTHIMYHGEKTLPRGDAAAFAHVGIPSIVITNWHGYKHAHVPSDIAEHVNRNYLVKATKLAFETVYQLSFGDYQGRSTASRKFSFEN